MYKVVLVDDDNAFLELFRKMVYWGKYGFSVCEVFNCASDVIDYIKQNSVDAVITDILMPKMKGTELAEYIYQNYPAIKVVFFSAYRELEYYETAVRYDVVGYINKPVSFTQLEEVLNKLKTVIDKDRNIGNEEFTDEDIIFEREKIFCDWFTNRDNYNKQFKEMLDTVNMSYNVLLTKCMLVVFKIQDIDYQLTNKWNHNEEDFYSAVTRVVFLMVVLM